ncbi:Predicted phospholipase, patatin/cPLA2 family [Cyclobacterium lianum]|uniref:Predicted phospholipase, patatin/cPLA2 family n=1 Tax=Cyclobacterium lianum TaxID=388280 RepID=A0A1M7QKB7_9BACT|nr:patatin-like phospholipase family protein [Cyclobacterium lianum]SHN31366.1 Predicted phospholipase, patatin/cPLA2 family [Cyclobacterium lianum]
MQQKRGLVISGGGSKGAFGGGIAEYLIRECNYKYDIFVGTSTGSLLVPLLSINEIERIKAIYTSVTQDCIFSTNPFIISKTNGVFKTRINHFSTIKMFLKGKKTFGESKALFKLIKKIITPADFEQMRQNAAEIYITVSNLSTNNVEYKRLKDCDYHDFCEWIWASSNMIPFMSLVEKDGCEYADGGFADLVPISEAIYRGATEVDVIVLKARAGREMKRPVRNALELTTRAFDFMLDQISSDDIKIGELLSKKRKVKLNFYYPPAVLTENSLIFDPYQMKKWWRQGKRFAREQNPVCKCIEVGLQEEQV